MPKLSRPSNRHRISNPVPLAPTLTMTYYTRSGMPAGYYTDATSGSQAALSIGSYDQYAVAPTLTIPPTGNPVGGPVGGAPLPAQHRASSGAWNQQDDHTLLAARASGQNWGQIQAAYFPNKTPNACRKRHERLMERKGADDWDARKLERIAKEYMSLRKEIWAPLAQRTGEKWSVVEQKCMSNGLKNLQSHARAYARKERLESGQPLGPGYDDDSGISGIGLTPVDDVDPATGGGSYSSPEASSSTGGGGSSSASHHHYGSSSMHATGSYQSYGHHGYGHGYNSSVSSTGTAGYAAGGAVGGGGAMGHSSQSESPYMGRLPSVDMGIEAIINRPGGAGRRA